MKDLDEIYFEARERLPKDRSAYLAAVCGDDQSLRERVEQMLAISDEAEAFIVDLPDVAPGGQRSEDNSSAPPKVEPALLPDTIVGQMIGRYKILERIGEGGFGVVYVAEQTEPMQRRVAVKVIKLGMDTRQVVARFEAERQALAMMDHPNIARVLDAGATESGRLYFVMELVRGIPITDYCNQSNLSTKERLELFIKVCQGIQHAHQKGIIHRDIKPSNILVTLHDGVPVPKVIDFGIAKAIEGRLTDATVYTQLQQFIGTPAYISPEQAEMSGLDIDTRSDIYSLGVLLYELLAGSTPFDARELTACGLDAMRKTIREKEPVRPSTKLASLKRAELTTAARQRSTEPPRLLHQLRGDLDWIVLKCLEKDRRRRYETANSLVADLLRHFGNEPVIARPPSTLYRFQKSFRRNKIVYLAVGAVMVTLLLGLVAVSWQALEADRARQSEFRQRIAAQKAQAESAAQQAKTEAERQRAEGQLARAEWLVYASKLILAQTDFESGNGGLTPHYLDQTQPKRRGWEYRYLRNRSEPRLTLAGQKLGVYGAAFSPDSQRVVTVSGDKARVWDAVTGQELFTLKGHKYMLTSAAFSADGQRIVTGAGVWTVLKSPSSETKIWDAQTGQPLLTIEGHAGCVHSVAISPDGALVATGSGDAVPMGAVTVYDARTGQQLHAFPALEVHSVAFSPDGHRIAAATMAGTGRVWDTTTGEEVLTLGKTPLGLRAIAFSPDGRQLVTGSMDDTARVWDATTGQQILVLRGHGGDLTSAAFSFDGKRILTAGWDQTARVWDAATGDQIMVLKGHTTVVRTAAFSPDGKRIVTGSDDRTAKIWDAETGQEVPVLVGHRDSISSIAFSPDSRRIVTGSADGSARIWDTRTARPILELKTSKSPSRSEAAVWAAAFSPDGERLITASEDHTARVWNATTGDQQLVLPHDRFVSCASFSPDGNRLLTAVGEWDQLGVSPSVAKIWDARTGRELLNIPHTHNVWSAAFSPDGKRIATAGGERSATIWDAATGGQLLKLTGHSGAIRCVAFSPDGKRVATSSVDRKAKIWDAATGKEILTLLGHTDTVRGVCFSPDGSRLVTGSDDRTARIWEAESGLELLSLTAHSHFVWSVAWSPDGQRIASGIAGQNGKVKLWYAPLAPGP